MRRALPWKQVIDELSARELPWDGGQGWMVPVGAIARGYVNRDGHRDVNGHRYLGCTPAGVHVYDRREREEPGAAEEFLLSVWRRRTADRQIAEGKANRGDIGVIDSGIWRDSENREEHEANSARWEHAAGVRQACELLGVPRDLAEKASRRASISPDLKARFARRDGIAALFEAGELRPEFPAYPEREVMWQAEYDGSVTVRVVVPIRKDVADYYRRIYGAAEGPRWARKEWLSRSTARRGDVIVKVRLDGTTLATGPAEHREEARAFAVGLVAELSRLAEEARRAG